MPLSTAAGSGNFVGIPQQPSLVLSSYEKKEVAEPLTGHEQTAESTRRSSTYGVPTRRCNEYSSSRVDVYPVTQCACRRNNTKIWKAAPKFSRTPKKNKILNLERLSPKSNCYSCMLLIFAVSRGFYKDTRSKRNPPARFSG